MAEDLEKKMFEMPPISKSIHENEVDDDSDIEEKEEKDDSDQKHVDTITIADIKDIEKIHEAAIVDNMWRQESEVSTVTKKRQRVRFRCTNLYRNVYFKRRGFH